MLPAVELEALDQVVGGKMKIAERPWDWDPPTKQRVEHWKSLPLNGAIRQEDRPVAQPKARPSAGPEADMIRESSYPVGQAGASCRVSILGWCAWR